MLVLSLCVAGDRTMKMMSHDDLIVHRRDDNVTWLISDFAGTVAGASAAVLLSTSYGQALMFSSRQVER